ncbi:MAG: T9SS type A sorting domain-containing protein, partial [Candidatus Kapaibacteriota bacterium]
PSKKVKIRVSIDSSLKAGILQDTIFIKSNGQNVIDSIKTVVIKANIKLPNYVPTTRDTTVIDCITFENVKIDEINIKIKDLNNSLIPTKIYSRGISNGVLYLDMDTILISKPEQVVKVKILPGFEDLYEEFVFKKDCFEFDTIKIRVKFNSRFYVRSLRKKTDFGKYEEDTLTFMISAPDLQKNSVERKTSFNSSQTIFNTTVKVYYLLDTLNYCNAFDLIFPKEIVDKYLDTIEAKNEIILKQNFYQYDSTNVKNSRGNFGFSDTIVKIREFLGIDTLYLISTFYSKRYTIISSAYESEIDAKSLILFPNPADNLIRLCNYSENAVEILEIDILNSLGENYYKFKSITSPITFLDEILINTANFPNGMYFIRINTSKGLLITKFLVKH